MHHCGIARRVLASRRWGNSSAHVSELAASLSDGRAYLDGAIIASWFLHSAFAEESRQDSFDMRCPIIQDVRRQVPLGIDVFGFIAYVAASHVALQHPTVIPRAILGVRVRVEEHVARGA